MRRGGTGSTTLQLGVRTSRYTFRLRTQECSRALNAGTPRADGATSARRDVASPTLTQPFSISPDVPLFAMPLCAACDFDDWLGSCHICLDIFEDIYCPVATSRHTTGPYTPHATGRFSPFLDNGLGALPTDNDGLPILPAVPVRVPGALPYHDGWQQRLLQFDPEEAEVPMDTTDPPSADGHAAGED